MQAPTEGTTTLHYRDSTGKIASQSYSQSSGLSLGELQQRCELSTLSRCVVCVPLGREGILESPAVGANKCDPTHCVTKWKYMSVANIPGQTRELRHAEEGHLQIKQEDKGGTKDQSSEIFFLMKAMQRAFCINYKTHCVQHYQM